MAKIKKTLGEILQENKYQTCNVKIGSKQGSSFWYCGKGNIAYSLPEIKKARASTLAQSHRTLTNYIYRLENLDKIYDDTIKKAKKRKMKDFDEYLRKLLKKKENEKVSLPKKIESVKYDIETHLLDRPVQEVVEGISLDEKPCWIIYVKGNEKGSYWTIKEYLKRHKELKNDY